MSPWLIPGFFIVAAAYTSVGLAGGSSYIALLLLSGAPYDQVRTLALACNLGAAGLAFASYQRAGHFRPRLVLPFLLGSVPMAFLGGRINLPKTLFSLLLGLSLLFAAIRLLLEGSRGTAQGQPGDKCLPVPEWPLLTFVLSGALIGLLSGLVGVGGGIFLGPLLILAGWADPKVSAASTSLFILVNSVAGLAGRASIGLTSAAGLDLGLLFGASLGGSLLGSSWGAFQGSRLYLRRILALLIFWASTRLLSSALAGA